ncbi:MAG: acetyl-CoA carboxylase biotin carboxyl carrier protein subunit [Cryomorphaceae bacterium BACL18 MAG-120924-bin36]|jgi:acetyl-CoA carboxylase biotin carboxyl carrier protein|nr:MAG: acetyl-CoA carboxylase biotin carboxyl carrier protein subunit [Cryomorphaceae bacterium BACL18 MAG-120924-bin36]KRP06449.1 MAG: acetyl-CoA carboxylase biotin carboxyl carrier protein subunit [Cryomorphaceae bacterium BACL18 MAG-120507-bin74]MDP5014489.1 acetyl-CoA carboxylase biotin carboxyl carrier protein [Schleiferiaceae bacterium]HAG33962.1 acetyl-CoA carboxylase, biotin carboxyl carrier protein [Cryomorphaceae bacterium]
MDLKELQNFIRFVAKSGAQEVSLETDDFKITVKTGPDGVVYAQAPVLAAAPTVAAAPVAAAAPAAPAEDTSKYVTVTAPMIGTFYRKPSPDKPVFVNVGDTVKAGQTVCIIEAMKLFNEIECEVSGTVVKVIADDMKPVEYGQPLFLVDPA